MSQPEGREAQQDDPDQRAEPLPERCGLLGDHHPGQQRHRQQAVHANPKHDQHQGPAAAQAERAVAQTQAPGCSYPLAIVVQEEAERAATLLETAPFERAELERTRECEGGRTNHPGMHVEPEPVIHQPVDPGISQKSTERERRPDDAIRNQERCRHRQRASLLPAGIHDHVDHRHAGWQHHAHRHDLPACQEHDQGHQHR